jgi:hypothetical protein
VFWVVLWSLDNIRVYRFQVSAIVTSSDIPQDPAKIGPKWLVREALDYDDDQH